MGQWLFKPFLFLDSKCCTIRAETPGGYQIFIWMAKVRELSCRNSCLFCLKAFYLRLCRICQLQPNAAVQIWKYAYIHSLPCLCSHGFGWIRPVGCVHKWNNGPYLFIIIWYCVFCLFSNFWMFLRGTKQCCNSFIGCKVHVNYHFTPQCLSLIPYGCKWMYGCIEKAQSNGSM